MKRRGDDDTAGLNRSLSRRQFGLTSLGALVSGGALLAGCKGADAPAGGGGTTSAGGTGSASKTVTYAVIPKMLNNPFFDIARNGALRAERDLEAADPSTDIKIEYQSSATGDVAEQVEVIRTMLQRKVDGLAIAVIDENAVRDVINEAVAQGIPTICWDSDCADSNRKTFYSVGDRKLGGELANQLVMASGGKLQPGDEIAILSGQSSAPNLQIREAGVREVLAKSPGIKILATLYCDDREDRAVELINTTMAAHPKLRGWVMVGGWPLFAANALDAIKDRERTKVICTDALEQQWRYLENGQCQVLVAQRPFEYGLESIRILENLRTGKKTDYPKVIAASFDLVYKEPTPEQRAHAKSQGLQAFSLPEYRKQWEEWHPVS